jgi:DNA-binding transcriptional ArsR family regulator
LRGGIVHRQSYRAPAIGRPAFSFSLAIDIEMSAKSTKPDRAKLAHIAELFRVFSEPTRLAILQLLRERPLSVNELVDQLETSQANVSKQLKTLYEADLLRREQRGNQVFYSIKEEMVFDLCALVCDKLNRTARASAEMVYQI